MSIKEIAVVVREQRLAYGEAKRQLAELQAKFETDNASLIAAVKTLGQDVAAGEDQLRQAAVSVFTATGERKPCPGIEVKDFTELVYDRKVALDWAKAHAMALTLDAKAFEGLVKAGADGLDFVTVSKVPKATIATDLGKALQESQP